MMSDGLSRQPGLTADAPAGGAKELLTLLEAQCGLFGQLAALADRQRGLISGDQAEPLLALLVERQKLIDELTALAGRLRPYQRDWDSVRERLSAHERERAEHLLGELQRRLRELAASDESDARLLAARKHATAEGISRVRESRQAGKAYAATGTGGGEGGMDWTDR